VLAGAACTFVATGCGGTAMLIAARSTPVPLTVPGAEAATRTVRATTSVTTTTTTTTRTTTTTSRKRTPPPPSGPPYAVGEQVVPFVDHSRMIRLPSGQLQPRTLVTIVRYPAVGPSSRVDVTGAPPVPGRFPLIVFGHGFAVTPYPYRKLLRAWASAGYIVAAPIFPLENANAPGGPNESDLIHQPRDVRFVITQMLRTYGSSISRREIAVSGQSDGGETALAVAYDPAFLDPRIRAAVILSAAEIPGIGFSFPPAGQSPPLLASQGTADTINLPFYTYQFFGIAPRPKYLLSLLGAHHLPPYTYEQPQLGIVERVTIAFFDHYLKHGQRGIQRMINAGNVPGTATLEADR
jgi:Chlorophyllase enzyme